MMKISQQTQRFSFVMIMIAFASFTVTAMSTNNESALNFALFFFVTYCILFVLLCFITALIEYPRLKKFEDMRMARKKRIDSAYEQLLPDIRSYELSKLPKKNMRTRTLVSRTSIIVSFLRSQDPDARAEDIVHRYESLGGKEDDIYFAITHEFFPEDSWLVFENQNASHHLM